jgi:hypothetical protein
MDHIKIALPRLQMFNKMISRLGQLPITIVSIISHGHGDKKDVQYSNELWPNNPNFTVGYLLQFFYTLEVAPISKSKLLFENLPHNSFFACLLQRKSCFICESRTPEQIVVPSLC